MYRKIHFECLFYQDKPSLIATATSGVCISSLVTQRHVWQPREESSCYRGDECDGGRCHIIQNEDDNDDDDDDSMAGVILIGTTLSCRPLQQVQEQERQLAPYQEEAYNNNNIFE